jgi:putative transposase
VESVTALEELFGAWVHQVYHQAVHSETGQAPAERFAAASSRLRRLAPRVIDEAFMWQDFRTVTKTATISLHGNRYQVDAALSGRKVELLYNPADLTGPIRVRWRGTDMGAAVPHVIGRHSHPGLAPAAPAPAPPTGIDYLRMVAGAHREAQAGSINFAALAGDRPGDAGGGGEAGPGETR